MTGKTLIVFSTVRGLNDEAAHVIADVLKTTYNMDVTVADLGKGSPEITLFQNIIVGGGGGRNSVYNEAVDFLEKDFGGRNVALSLWRPKAENTPTKKITGQKQVSQAYRRCCLWRVPD
jgi:menaquinone-dependent protoporphyrinogen IX oxidase